MCFLKMIEAKPIIVKKHKHEKRIDAINKKRSFFLILIPMKTLLFLVKLSFFSEKLKEH